jgi:hypothetical protein
VFQNVGTKSSDAGEITQKKEKIQHSEYYESVKSERRSLADVTEQG